MKKFALIASLLIIFTALFALSISAADGGFGALAGKIDDSIDLISPTVIEPIQKLKVSFMGSKNPRRHPDEILMALAFSAVTNPTAKVALNQLSKLVGTQIHSTVQLSHSDIKTLKKLGIDVTCEPRSKTDSLFKINRLNLPLWLCLFFSI